MSEVSPRAVNQETTLPGAAPPADSLSEPADRLPSFSGYEVLEELGRGGMGVVYKARQPQLERLVALKMILSGEYASAGERARFLTEAQAIARIQHANIVQLYEVGEREGRPFLSLEFCDGGCLDERLKGNPLPDAEAATLVEQLARAMAAAHAVGIVHRDLKPANVLFAGPGLPKITDFGLARNLEETRKTQSGAVLGTPSYMAPEQAQGRTGELGPAVDVYALGAILYECLTGRPPFRGTTSMDTLYQVVACEPAPPRRLNPAAARDLEVICLKCLHKSPARRYATAQELADELRRYLNREPIRARPVGRLERAWSWSRRKPALATLGLLLLLSLAGGVTGVVWQWRQAVANAAEAEGKQREANHLRVLADEQRERVEQREREQRRFVYTALMAQVPAAWERGDVQTVHRHLRAFLPQEGDKEDLRGFEWHHYWKLLHPSRLTLWGHESEVKALAFSPDGRWLVSGGQDRTLRLWDVQLGQQVWSVTAQADIRELVFAPDGKRILFTAGSTSTLQEINLDKGSQIGDSHKGTRCAAISPDGQLAVLARENGTLELLVAGKRNTFFPRPPGRLAVPLHLSFLANGRTLVAVDGINRLFVWDIDTAVTPVRVTLKSTTEGALYAGIRPALDPVTDTLVGADLAGVLTVWKVDAGTGQLVRETRRPPPHPGVTALGVARDGNLVISGGDDGKVRLFDLARDEALPPLAGHVGGVRALAVSPDGRRLATGGIHGGLRVWDLESAARAGRAGAVNAVRFSPVEDVLATAGDDGTVRLWDVRTGQEQELQRDAQRLLSLAYTPDGKVLAAGDDRGRVTLWELARRRPARHFDVPHSATSLTMSPDGKRLAVGTADGWVHVFALDDSRYRYRRRLHHRRVADLCFTPDGTTLASAGWDRLLGLIELEAQSVRLLPEARPVSGVSFVGRGEQVLSVTSSQLASLRDYANTNLVRSLGALFETPAAVAASKDGKSLFIAARMGERDRVYLQSNLATPPATPAPLENALMGGPRSLALSKDETLLAVAGDNGVLALWEVARRKTRVLPGHARAVTALACSPDGRTLAVGRADFTVRLLDAATRQERAVLRGHEHLVTGVAFSPDGQFLASAAHDKTIRLWEPSTATLRATWTVPQAAVLALAIAPDGRTLAAGGSEANQGVLLWDVTTGKVRQTLRGHRWKVRQLAFVPGRDLLVSVSGDDYAFPGELKLWDATTGKELACQVGGAGGIRALAVSPDGRSLATADSYSRGTLIRLWDISDPAGPRVVVRFEGLTGHIRALAFAPDGRTLVSGGDDRTLRFWQPQRGEALGALRQPSAINCLAFNREGTTLFIGEADGTLAVRETATAAEIAALLRPESPASAQSLDLIAESQRLEAALKRQVAQERLASGAPATAARALQEAVGILDRLTERRPDWSAGWQERAQALLALAELQLADNPSAAAGTCAQAHQSLGRWATLTGGADVGLLAVRASQLEAASWSARKQEQEARRAYSRAAALLVQRFEQKTLTGPLWQEAVTLVRNVSDGLERHGETTTARSLRERGIVEVESLLAHRDVAAGRDAERDERHPLWDDLAYLLEALARVQADRSEEQLQTLRLFEKIAAGRARVFPGDLGRGTRVARACRLLAEALERDAPAEAAAVYRVAAGLLATWATRAERGEPARRLADEAMTLLARAVRHGYKNAANLEKATDLEGLRSRDDFKKLLAQVVKGPEGKR